MTIANPAQTAIDSDLSSRRFRSGVRRGFWRVVNYAFPNLTIAVAATEPDGAASEYGFRFDLTGFPGTAPIVIIWDFAGDKMLPADRRPRGCARVVEAFKVWNQPTVYRPWDRLAGAHNNWNQTYPQFAWHPKRDITFILEDLHELLNLNACARSVGQAA